MSIIFLATIYNKYHEQFYLAGADLWSNQKDIQDTHTVNNNNGFYLVINISSSKYGGCITLEKKYFQKYTVSRILQYKIYEFRVE